MIRIRVPGGRLGTDQWLELADASRQLGDGFIHLTSRANVQLRAIRDPAAVAERLERVGLLPRRSHDLVRNLMCSPLTGLAGGSADLRPLLAELDRLMLSDAALAHLPGKFLVALDDGRGDVGRAPHDLGAMAIDHQTVQLTVDGAVLGETTMAAAPRELVHLMHVFLSARGASDGAAWHVRELPDPPAELVGREAMEWPHWSRPEPGQIVSGGRVVGDWIEVHDGVLTADAASELASKAKELVVTPWHSVVRVEAIAG